VHRIATAVFGLPVLVTQPFESVAVGAAKQAAWALTGELRHWSVPVLSEHQPDRSDLTAAEELQDRYRTVLEARYLHRP
jgi:xylulokinase